MLTVPLCGLGFARTELISPYAHFFCVCVTTWWVQITATSVSCHRGCHIQWSLTLIVTLICQLASSVAVKMTEQLVCLYQLPASDRPSIAVKNSPSPSFTIYGSQKAKHIPHVIGQENIESQLLCSLLIPKNVYLILCMKQCWLLTLAWSRPYSESELLFLLSK